MTRRRYHGFIMDSARWDAYDPRAGDVIVTTPPKCGTTWMQMCCLVLLHGPTLPAPLSVLSPWYEQLLTPPDEINARLAAQEHRRIIKTHTPFDGLPWHDEVLYVGVGRDPRDVALSLSNHRQNMDAEVAGRARVAAGESDPPALPARPTEPVELFLHFVEDESPIEDFTASLQFVIEHLRQLWARRHETNVAVFHYSDLRADLDGEMRRLAALLGVDVDETEWPALVDAASLASMRQQADRLAPDADRALWRSNEQFFAEGRVGGWRKVIPPETLARYDDRVAALGVDDELLEWLHGGHRTRAA